MAIKVTADFTRKKPLEVIDKDPGKAYRWVRDTNLAQRKMEGWEPVKKGGKIEQYREMILCEMPKESNEEIKQAPIQRAVNQVKAAKQRYKAEAEKLGVQIVE